MSKKGINQLEIIKQINSGKISQKYGAEILALSARQLRRKQKRYNQEGIEGLKHKSKGKKSNNKIPDKKIKKILELIKKNYSGYGPTLISEKLEEKYKIKIDHETLRRSMISFGLWEVKRKKTKVYVWRERKKCEGEMVQADGSRHQWLTDEYIDLLCLIDDATGKIYIKFASESTKEFFKFFREFIEQNGIPQSFYSDRGKVFKVNNSKKENLKTQFERMLKELNCKISHAGSPQAKGRVERIFRTLQDRLFKELRENKIKTIEEANKYLEDSNFIEKYNNKFAVEAASKAVVYQTIKNFNLNSIFCLKYYRKINNDHTIQFKNNWYQLEKKQPMKLKPGLAVEVRINFDGTIEIYRNSKKLNCKPIEKRKEKVIKNEPKEYPSRIVKPNKNHPWKRWVEKEKKADISTELKRGHFY